MNSDAESADILVVDDNPNNLSLLVSLLAGQGFHPRPAISGAIALQAAFGRPPDLILLDVRMSGMDGYAVCRQLKADERTASIPVIFLSALENVEDKVKAFETGGVDYITKPFDEREVLTRIRAHLALVRAQQMAAQQAARDERRRLGRELHDSVTQTLASLALYTHGWQQRVGQATAAEVSQWLAQLEEITAQALKEMRLLLYQIDPPESGNIDLEGAIQLRLAAVEKRVGIKATFESGEKIALSPRQKQELLAITMEALNNALKHAHAAAVKVDLSGTETQAILSIEDDGQGFLPEEAQAGGGMGIRTMRERARLLGGTLDIVSQPGKGTRVQLTVPMEGANVAE